MTTPIRILLQTTIPFAEDDWHIGRFSKQQMRFSRRLIQLSILSLFCLAAFASAARGQQKTAIQTCESAKITKTRYGAEVVETATCINPRKKFKPTLRNIFVVATFPAFPTGARVTFMIKKDDPGVDYVENQDRHILPRQTTAYMKARIMQTGKYLVRIANYSDQTEVWATTDFTVGEDTVGPRATGLNAAGEGRVSICKEIDDNFKCVGAANVWKANAPFNILFENTEAGVESIGIVFYKQDAQGRDFEFVDEYEQNIGAGNRSYATVGDKLRLPAGVYTVYIIDWDKRELSEHRGNLTEFFAKRTLTVK